MARIVARATILDPDNHSLRGAGFLIRPESCRMVNARAAAWRRALLARIARDRERRRPVAEPYIGDR